MASPPSNLAARSCGVIRARAIRVHSHCAYSAIVKILYRPTDIAEDWFYGLNSVKGEGEGGQVSSLTRAACPKLRQPHRAGPGEPKATQQAEVKRYTYIY